MGGGNILEGGWACARAQGWAISYLASKVFQLALKVTTTICPSACTYPSTFS